MGSALSAAVTGLKAHQYMLDVAGNNLANINTVGFKSSSITFAELLSQTIKNASGPSANLGGVNPQQMGNGVGIASVTRNMTQGSINSTGQDLDAAIDGAGYFVLNDGLQNVYTHRVFCGRCEQHAGRSGNGLQGAAYGDIRRSRGISDRRRQQYSYPVGCGDARPRRPASPSMVIFG